MEVVYILEIILLCHSMEEPELTLRITMPSKLEEPFVPITTVMFHLIESTVIFMDNRATHGGSISAAIYSNISSEGKSTVEFNGNIARDNGGAINSIENCAITFYNLSSLKFIGNRATRGGAVNSEYLSEIKFDGNSTVTFRGNDVSSNGGALHCHTKCIVLVTEHSVVTFSDNRATDGGAVFSSNYSQITFSNRSTIKFFENRANQGGALCTKLYSNVLFDGKSMVKFYNNSVHKSGGAISFVQNCNVIFTGNATV